MTPRHLTHEALALGARALPLSDPLRRPDARVALVFNPAGLPSAARAALEARHEARLEPFAPPRAPEGFSPTEVVLEAPASLVAELAVEHPTLLHLLDAQAALDAPPAAPRIMGVLNVTPDSFSDGGQYLDAAAAVDHGLRLAREGAHLVDVGGESTRPGADPVDEAEERRRVEPVVRALAAEGVAVSIDTRRASIAEAALEAGAVMVNDVSGGLFDPRLLPLAAERGCELVLMHAQGDPATMQADPRYGDATADVARVLRARAAAAVEAGVEPGRLLLDPGIGFGKRLEHNLALLRRLPELRSLGQPLLLGVSRKSFIGHITGAERQEDWRAPQRRDRPEERLGGTAAAVAACVLGGAQVLRVHDVGVMGEAIAVAAALGGPTEAARPPGSRRT